MISPVPELLTLDQAIAHLRLDPLLSASADNPETIDLQLKIDAATALVVEYIWRDDDTWVDTIVAWTAATVPKAIKAAVMVQLGELYRFRGDDPAKVTPDRGHGFLSPTVTAYLHRFRDPSVA